MRRVREILRLKFAASLPIREIARLVGTAPSTVRAALERFQAASLTWPLPEQVSDSDLEAALYTNIGSKQGHRRHVEPGAPDRARGAGDGTPITTLGLGTLAQRSSPCTPRRWGRVMFATASSHLAVAGKRAVRRWAESHFP